MDLQKLKCILAMSWPLRYYLKTYHGLILSFKFGRKVFNTTFFVIVKNLNFLQQKSFILRRAKV